MPLAPIPRPSRHRHAEDLLREGEERLAILRSACAEEESRLAELEKLIPKRTADLDALKNTIRESPGGSLYLELKPRIREFVGEINRMKETGRTLESALTARVNGA
jgi:chromosome segregation ATPase